jgi:hypothetical protein
MTQIAVDPEFPDMYYELNLTSLDRVSLPILQILPVSAKLVDGVYHRGNGFRLYAHRLMSMSANERGTSMLCRHIKCLEQDIPKAVALMREDILKEAQHMFEVYQEKLAVFKAEPFTTDENNIYATRFINKLREQLGDDIVQELE